MGSRAGRRLGPACRASPVLSRASETDITKGHFTGEDTGPDGAAGGEAGPHSGGVLRPAPPLPNFLPFVLLRCLWAPAQGLSPHQSWISAPSGDIC